MDWQGCSEGFPKGDLTAVLPSSSALSDLGLMGTLFEKMLLNWSSFCLKSLLFGQKVIFSLFSVSHKAKNNLQISLNMEYFQIKVDLPNVRIRFLEEV